MKSRKSGLDHMPGVHRGTQCLKCKSYAHSTEQFTLVKLDASQFGGREACWWALRRIWYCPKCYEDFVADHTEERHMPEYGHG